MGIHGNEEADRLANEGKNRATVDENIKLGPTEIKSLITNKIKEKYTQKRWSKDNKSRLYKINPKFDSKVNKHNAELQQTAPGAIRLIIIMNKR